MSTRSERDRQKALQEKHQMILSQLLKDEDNKYCVDCDAKGPRWASWNLGIFLCIRCAGIHRNLGVHISKVKSVNLDTWTPEQIAMMQEMGNSRARAVYEANVPDSYRRPQTDSALEAFIRSKYEQKKYIAHEWVPPQPKIQSCDNTVTRHKKTPKYQDPIFEEMPKKDKKKSRSKTDSTLKLNAPPEKVASKSTPHTETYKKHYSEADIKPPVKSAPVDLLGLDDPAPSIVPSSNDINDPFGAFIGCPTTNVTSTPSQQPVTSQPDLVSTVNQNGDLSQLSNSNNVAANPGTSTENGDISLIGDSSSGGAAEKKSKESILALYGSGGGGNTQQQMYSVPGGMYMQGQQMPAMSQQAQMYPGGQMSNGMVSGIQPGLMTQPQNNMMQYSNSSLMCVDPLQEQQNNYYYTQQQGVPMWNTNMAMPVNNMQGQNAGMAGMNPGMVNNMMMGGQPMYNNTGNMYNMQNQQMHQLQNQMGSMNMGQQSMGGYQQPSAVGVGTGMAGNWGMQQTGNTLSTNLWQ